MIIILVCCHGEFRSWVMVKSFKSIPQKSNHTGLGCMPCDRSWCGGIQCSYHSRQDTVLEVLNHMFIYLVIRLWAMVYLALAPGPFSEGGAWGWGYSVSSQVDKVNTQGNLEFWQYFPLPRTRMSTQGKQTPNCYLWHNLDHSRTKAMLHVV